MGLAHGTVSVSRNSIRFMNITRVAALLVCIQEMSLSNFGGEVENPDCFSSCFFTLSMRIPEKYMRLAMITIKQVVVE